MLPDLVSNPGPLTYESGALPIALRGPACWRYKTKSVNHEICHSDLYIVGHLQCQTDIIHSIMVIYYMYYYLVLKIRQNH